MVTRAFADLVARQAGVVALAQVAAAGVPARTVRRWRARGGGSTPASTWWPGTG